MVTFNVFPNFAVAKNKTYTTMKKIILLIVAMIALFASTAMAQEQEKKVKYHGEVFVAGDASWSNVIYDGQKASDTNLLMYGTSLHTIHGVKIGDYFSIGLGLGIDFIIGADEETVGSAELSGLLIPTYLDCKFWIPTKGKVTPFFMAEGGGSFMIYPQTIRPLYGAGVGFKAGKFMMSLGYMNEGFNLRDFIYESDDLKFYQHKLQVRIGVAF